MTEEDLLAGVVRLWPLGLLLLVYGAWRAGQFVGYRRRLRVATQGSHRALAGAVAERWAPWLEGFPGRASEARFLGAPVDYIVFHGIDAGEITEVTFVEVKAGRSTLSRVERSLRDCIREGKVRWVRCDVPLPDAADNEV